MRYIFKEKIFCSVKGIRSVMVSLGTVLYPTVRRCTFSWREQCGTKFPVHKEHKMMEETYPFSLGPSRRMWRQLSAGPSLRLEARFVRTAMRPGNDAEVQLNYLHRQVNHVTSHTIRRCRIQGALDQNISLTLSRVFVRLFWDRLLETGLASRLVDSYKVFLCCVHWPFEFFQPWTKILNWTREINIS